MTNENTAYNDANELPSVTDLKFQIRGCKMLKPIVYPLASHDQRKEFSRTLKDTENKLNSLTNMINKFYQLLGDRHWIFTDTFPTDDMKRILDTDSTDVAEQRLINWYLTDDNIGERLIYLNRQAGFRSRMPLIHKALEDYKAQRYYSTVYILLSQVDGFVNDEDPQLHRSLSAEDDPDMSAYDSAVSVANALPQVADVYKKGFSKFSDQKVTEVYRNGILHGQLSNFDNEIVATKAWNLLFAILDWAEASEKYKKHQEDLKAPQPSWKEVLEKAERNDEVNQLLEQWKPYETDISNDSDDPSGVRKDCTDFFEGWLKKNYMIVGHHLPNMNHKTAGQMAAEAKQNYADHPIESYTLKRIENLAAGWVYTTVNIKPANGSSYMTKLHWTRVKSPSGFDTAFPDEDGLWVITGYGVDPFRPNSNMTETN